MIQTGGLGSIGGGLTGAVVMAGLHEAITLAGEKLGFTEVSRFEQLIYGLLLVLVLIFCPKGLVPALHGGGEKGLREKAGLRTLKVLTWRRDGRVV